MGVRLRNEFTSIAGIEWKIDIHDTDYSSSVLTFTTSLPGFTLKYMSGKERYDPIIASQVKVFGLVEDSDLEDLITDVTGAGEGRFFVQIYKDAALEWSGKMLMDKARKQDMDYPYSFDMTFTDGIGALKKIDFDDDGTLYTGTETILEIITKILEKTGITDLFGATDDFLKTCVHWYDVHHNFYAKWCPLLYSRLDHAAFYDYKDDENEPKSSWDVLEEILFTWGAIIRQSGGLFQIIQPNEYVNLYLMTRTFNKTGGYKSYNYYEDYRSTSNDYDKLTGGITKYYPPLLEVTRKYFYKHTPGGTNLIPDQTSYPIAVDFLNGISGGDDEHLYFGGIVHERVLMEKENPPFRIKYRMDIIIDKGDGTLNYLYNGPVGMDNYTWSSDSNHCITLWGNWLRPITPGVTMFKDSLFSFHTEAIPWNATGTFKFIKIDGFYSVDPPYKKINLIGASFSFTCDDFFLQQLGSDGSSTEGEIFFLARNNNTDTYSKTLKIPDAFIGDGPGINSLGKIEASDGNTWNNSTLWSIKSGSEQKKIHQLLVDEVISGQQVPCDILDASYISSSYTAVKTIIIGASGYVPMNVTLAASNDVWKGRWWKIRLQSVHPTTGLWIGPADYEAGFVWNLKGWDTQNIIEEETDFNPEAPVTNLPQIVNDLSSQSQNLYNILQFTKISEDISSDDVKTSISIDILDHVVFQAGDWFYLTNRDGSALERLQISTDQTPGATSLDIESHTFVNNFSIGSRVLVGVYDVIAKLTRYWILDDGSWRDAGSWQDSDKWKDT